MFPSFPSFPSSPLRRAIRDRSVGVTPRVVVIGAGFGGLAAAIRLQARGFGVTLVDKRDAPGGRAYVYRDAGFAFDGGPTVVTAPFLLEELFALAGKRMEEHLTLVPVDPFYRIRFHDGRVFDYTGDGERMAAEVAKFSPGDVDGYRRFVEESQKIFAVGFEELGDVPFSRARDMLKIIPQMIKLRSHLSVWRLVCKYIKDDALRVVMSFHPLLVGGNPFTTTSIYTLIAYLERKWGVWFAKGGTGAIVQALVDLFVSLGGTLELGAAAEEILVENGRVSGVRLAGGRTLPATIVVSNGDAPATYKRLVAGERAQEVHRRQDRSHALFDELVRFVLRNEKDVSRYGAPHDPARAALSRAACTTSSTRRFWRPTSACTCTHRRGPTRRWRRPAARTSTCCRRCRTSSRATTGPSAARSIRKSYSRISKTMGFPDYARTW